jgi:hypothetical protein
MAIRLQRTLILLSPVQGHLTNKKDYYGKGQHMIFLRFMSAVTLPAMLILLSGCGGESATITPASTPALTANDTDNNQNTSSAEPTAAPEAAPAPKLVKRNLQRRAVPGRPTGSPVVSKALADNLNAGNLKEAERFIKMGADVDYVGGNL